MENDNDCLFFPRIIGYTKELWLVNDVYHGSGYVRTMRVCASRVRCAWHISLRQILPGSDPDLNKN